MIKKITIANFLNIVKDVNKISEEDNSCKDTLFHHLKLLMLRSQNRVRVNKFCDTIERR